ncbi:MAG: hypothetical protein JNM43_22510 [Planctomycetaceae bacterium]|nr:hypothetical protein [Planctomycetaceae bacterium]
MSNPVEHEFEHSGHSIVLGCYVNSLLSQTETQYVPDRFFRIGVINRIEHLIDVIVWFSDEYHVRLLGHLSLPLEVKELLRRQGIRPIGLLNDSSAKKLKKHVQDVAVAAQAVGASFRISPDHVRSVGKLLSDVLDVFQREYRPNFDLHLFAKMNVISNLSSDS